MGSLHTGTVFSRFYPLLPAYDPTDGSTRVGLVLHFFVVCRVHFCFLFRESDSSDFHSFGFGSLSGWVMTLAGRVGIDTIFQNNADNPEKRTPLFSKHFFYSKYILVSLYF